MRLDLSKIPDFYTREIFRQVIAEVNDIRKNGSGAKSESVTNVINQGDRLDGSSNIRGTIEPDADGVHSLGSSTKRLNELHAKELYLDNNTLYIGGSPALSRDESTGEIKFSNDPNKDVKIEATGSGKVILDCESDVDITTTGNVTVNGSSLVKFNTMAITSNEIVNSFDFIIGHVPVTNSETISYNGIVLTEGEDYTINQNTVTLLFAIGGDDLVRIKYAY